MEAYKKHYSTYTKLRNSIDRLSDKLSRQHNTHMQCTKGCDLCCMDYSILPIEFQLIKEQLNKAGFKPETANINAPDNGCIFLKNHACTIYAQRPIICRTHGLPLLFTNDDYEWELSTCELNFRQFDYENFSSENTFPQDTFNSKLFMLNKEFIAEPGNEGYGELDLIPLKKLAEI